LPRIHDKERTIGDEPTNPFTGGGFGATRRAVDPRSGEPLTVIPNEELVFPERLPIPEGSELVRVTSAGEEVLVRLFDPFAN
jgi:hypothetical protein